MRTALLRKVIVLLTASLLALASATQDAATLGPAKGNLVIVGGGATGQEIWSRFLALAGGAENANIVVVPTAGMAVPDDGKVPETSTPRVLERLGVKHVTVLHTRDRKVADSEEFVKPLLAATAVWFDGGRQWHIADSYLGTRTQKEFEAVLERGGVIGGSSAGATIQGEYLWRGDTKGPEVGEGPYGWVRLPEGVGDRPAHPRAEPDVRFDSFYREAPEFARNRNQRSDGDRRAWQRVRGDRGELRRDHGREEVGAGSSVAERRCA